MASPDEIVEYCQQRLSDDDQERLTCWIAWRQGRNQALAGDRLSLERLRHAATHWLSNEERGLLLGWMRRRADRGEPQVPA